MVSEAMLTIHLGNNEEHSFCILLSSNIFFVVFIFLGRIKTSQANQRSKMEKYDNNQLKYLRFS